MVIKFQPHEASTEDYLFGEGDEGPGKIHREKADWHRKRAGKLRNASIKAVGKHTYAAELLERGVAEHHPDHPDHDFAFNPD